jgi:hypothetical protein
VLERWTIVELIQLRAKDFSQLSAPDQDRFLAVMEKGEVTFATVPATVFFGQLLTNTKEGYFSDPLYGGKLRPCRFADRSAASARCTSA